MVDERLPPGSGLHVRAYVIESELPRPIIAAARQTWRRLSGLVPSILLCLAPVASATYPPPAKPVPPGNLRGNTLLVPEKRLAIDAPGEGWQWMYYGDTSVFFAQRAPGEEPARVAFGDARSSLKERTAHHIANTKQYYREAGYRVASVRSESVTHPVAGTRRVVIRVVHAENGVTLHDLAYLLPAGVTLETASTQPSGPPWLDAWLESCRIGDGPR